MSELTRSAGAVADVAGSVSVPAPEFSFVMPVYNAAATVLESARSVLDQEGASVELICVDDGSVDATPQVLDELAAADPRVRVVHQKNAGPSKARNVGLDLARGAYVCTIDADDALAPGACARLSEVFARTAAEVVVFGAVCEPEGGASERIQSLLAPEAATYYPRDAFDARLLFRANAQPYAWRAAIARPLEDREHVRFPEGVRLAEDVAFLFTLYPLAERVELISDKLYRYRMLGTSITHGLDAPGNLERKVSEHLAAFRAIFDAWASRGLTALCPAEMVTWCLDLTAFDLVRLDEAASARAVRRLAALLAAAYGDRWCELPAHAAVRAVAQAVSGAAGAGGALRLSKLLVMRFFLATRGLRACAERVLR